MKLKDLIKWALNTDIPLEAELSTPHGKVTMFSRDIENNTIIMNDKSVSFKVLEMMQQTGCTKQQAELYLSNNNWNVPLAIVSYQRDKEYVKDVRLS